MGRMSWVLGLLVLAGCGQGEGMIIGAGLASSSSADPVMLTVANQGTQAVYGVAEDWDGAEKHSFTLNPGDVDSFEFDGTVDRVKLHVWRSSDSFLIFDDFWDAADMKHGVTVTVNP